MPEHRGDDAEPEAAGAAARGARPVDGDAERADELERVPQPEGDALEHSPHERAAVVPELEAGEGGAGAGDRHAASARLRGTARTGGPSAPGPHASASATRSANDVSGREPVAQPLQRARRRQHHAHRVPLAGNARGRTRAPAPAGRRERPAAPRRRRRRCPSRSRAAPAGRSRRRPPRRRSRPRRRRPGFLVTPPSQARVDAAHLRRLEHRRQPRGRRARARRAPPPTSERRATSSSSVPEASATSVAHSPVSRSRT